MSQTEHTGEKLRDTAEERDLDETCPLIPVSHASRFVAFSP